jgi:hypothetical protein
MTGPTPPTRLLDPREDEVVARLHRYATAGAPPMALETGAVITAAHRHTTARRVRGAAVSTFTVLALVLGGAHLAGLEQTADDTPAVAGVVRVLTVANGVTASSLPARVRGDIDAVDLGLEFADVPTGLPITLSSRLGSLVLEIPLDPAANATGATSQEVRLDPWIDPDGGEGTTFRTITSTGGDEMLVVGTVPRWVDAPVVELVGEQDPGFVLPDAATPVDRVQVPTFDAPGEGTGRMYAAVISAGAEAAQSAPRIDALRLVPVVTSADGTSVVGGPCAGLEQTARCLQDTVEGVVQLDDVATVQVASGITATSRLGAPAPVQSDAGPRFDLGITVEHPEMPTDRLVVLADQDPPSTSSWPAPIGLEWLGVLTDPAWTTAVGGTRQDAAVDAVSTTTSYAAVGTSWILTGTVPGSVAPDALAHIELSAPVVRADGSRTTFIDVPTFDPIAGDGRRAFVAVVDAASGLPGPSTGASPLAPSPTTFVRPGR